MLLVEITINSTLHRVSNEDLALTHLWKSYVADLSDLQFRLYKKHGGYVEPSFGSIEFSPELFADEWTPPESCVITIKHSETTEEAATTVFDGVAHLRQVMRGGVEYGLYQQEFDYSVDGQVFSDTLVNVVDWACDASRLNLTLDSTNARATSPIVSYTTKDVVLIDEMSKVCAFFSHYFFIDGSTLYLVDCLYSGTPTTITEFDIFPSEYEYPSPYSKFKTSDNSIDGSRAYGKEYSVGSEYHATGSLIETAMGNIKTLVESPESVLKMPIEKTPSIGEFLTLVDDSFEDTITTTQWVQEISYNFNDNIAAVRCLITSIA